MDTDELNQLIRSLDLLLVPGSAPVVRVNGSLEKVGGGEVLSAERAFDLLSPSLSAERPAATARRASWTSRCASRASAAFG